MNLIFSNRSTEPITRPAFEILSSKQIRLNLDALANLSVKTMLDSYINGSESRNGQDFEKIIEQFIAVTRECILHGFIGDRTADRRETSTSQCEMIKMFTRSLNQANSSQKELLRRTESVSHLDGIKTNRHFITGIIMTSLMAKTLAEDFQIIIQIAQSFKLWFDLDAYLLSPEAVTLGCLLESLVIMDLNFDLCNLDFDKSMKPIDLEFHFNCSKVLHSSYNRGESSTQLDCQDGEQKTESESLLVAHPPDYAMRQKESIEVELRVLRMKFEELNDKYKILDDDHNQLLQEYKTNMDVINSHAATIADLTRNCDEKNEQINILTAQISRLEESSKSYLNKMKKLDADLEERERCLIQMSTLLDQTKEQEAALLARLENSLESVNENQLQQSAHSKKIKDLEFENESLKKKCERVIKESHGLAKALQRVEFECTSNAKENEELHKIVAEKEKTINEQNLKIEDSVKALVEVSDKIAMYELQISNFKCQLAVKQDSGWVDDKEIGYCILCKKEFNLFNRKHHCRVCGKVFCQGCCNNFIKIRKKGEDKDNQRCCQSCYENAIRISATPACS